MTDPLALGALDETLAALGALLASRDLCYELVLVGGASLQLLGVITRPTRDVDVLGARVGDFDARR